MIKDQLLAGKFRCGQGVLPLHSSQALDPLDSGRWPRRCEREGRKRTSFGGCGEATKLSLTQPSLGALHADMCVSLVHTHSCEPGLVHPYCTEETEAQRSQVTCPSQCLGVQLLFISHLLLPISLARAVSFGKHIQAK